MPNSKGGMSRRPSTRLTGIAAVVVMTFSSGGYTGRLDAQAIGFIKPVIAGRVYASQFGAWTLGSPLSVPAGTVTLSLQPCTVTLPDGPPLAPVSNGTLLTLSDAAGNSENIIPQSVTYAGGNCRFQAVLLRAHPGKLTLRSATGGLQEAIRWLGPGGGTVILSPDWQGSDAMLQQVSASSGTLLIDERHATVTTYGWSGGAYRAVSSLGAAGWSWPVITPSITSALPPAGVAGRLAFTADGARNLTVDTGSGWYSPTGSTIDVRAYGATGDGVATSHGSCSAGSNLYTLDATYTAPTEPRFTSAAVGEQILAYQCGAGGTTLVSTIQSYNSPTQITMAAAASRNVGTGSGFALWGHDDTQAIQAAVGALSPQFGTLYFPHGIYLTTAPLVLQRDGVVVSGDGDPGPYGLGFGTRLVYTGAAGGVPASGTDKALLTISGSNWRLRDLRLDAGGLASYALQIPTDAAGAPAINLQLRVSNVGLSWARYFGGVIGSAGATPYAGRGLLGELLFDNVEWNHNGCERILGNCTTTATDLTNGGGWLVNYGSGNFDTEWVASQGLEDSMTQGAGGHSVYWVSGNYGGFDQCYFPPLGAINSASVLISAEAVALRFTSAYDENGFFLDAMAGDLLRVSDLTIRNSGSWETAHQALRVQSGARVVLDRVFTGGLPVLVSGNGQVEAHDVESGGFESSAGQLLNASLTRTSGTLTAVTSVPHTFLPGDWVQIIGADSASNGTYQIRSVPTATSYTVATSQPDGAAVPAGRSQFAQGIIDTSNGSLTGTSPFLGLGTLSPLTGANASLSDALAAALTNPSCSRGILTLYPGLAGANGSGFPASLPATCPILDLRGGSVGWWGEPFKVGSGFYLGNTLLQTGASSGNGNLVLDTGASLTAPSLQRPNFAGAAQGSLDLHLAQLTEPASYVVGAATITNPAASGTLAVQSALRMSLAAFLPGVLTTPWTALTWTPDLPIIVTRLQATVKTAPAGCTTNAVVSLTQGGAVVTLPILAAGNDSGAIVLSLAAGTPVTLAVTTAASGCATSPADANLVAQYRMP